MFSYLLWFRKITTKKTSRKLEQLGLFLRASALLVARNGYHGLTFESFSHLPWFRKITIGKKNLANLKSANSSEELIAGILRFYLGPFKLPSTKMCNSVFFSPGWLSLCGESGLCFQCKVGKWLFNRSFQLCVVNVGWLSLYWESGLCFQCKVGKWLFNRNFQLCVVNVGWMSLCGESGLCFQWKVGKWLFKRNFQLCVLNADQKYLCAFVLNILAMVSLTVPDVKFMYWRKWIFLAITCLFLQIEVSN